jgi:ERF superfamily
MNMESNTPNPQFSTRLGCRDGLLCVVAERRDGPQAKAIRLWYPVREAQEMEFATLEGRPVRETDQKQGIYIDEEGAVFQLAQKGATRPSLVEEVADQEQGRQALPAATLSNGRSPSNAPATKHGHTSAVATSPATAQAEPDHLGPKALMRKRRGQAGAALKVRREPHRAEPLPAPAARRQSVQRERRAGNASPTESDMNLRQKLAEVRRRIGYIQKRGHNERGNYRYVTAADIAGAVGDLLAELGVVIVPSLESISYVPTRNSSGQIERVACVIMSYTFTDVISAEKVTVKVPGEGLDGGDKATYKAMTGALKYALLQSFLLASGDDPEDDRHEVHHRTAATGTVHPDRKVNATEVAGLKQLIDETATEVERVLAYYKVASLDEMTEPVYRRAIELLNRKRAAQTRREVNHHAQG